MQAVIFHLELITPCFCAGSIPAIAELRAPSIRGKLRWWFRVLGGNRGQELEVFGGVSRECKRPSARGEIPSQNGGKIGAKEVSDGCGTSSALVVRVSDVDIRRQWSPISITESPNSGYLLYFAKASGNGARWVAGGAIPPGASFQLQLLWRRKVSSRTQELFDLALDAFLLLGSLGLRSTRGLGCFETRGRPFSREALETLMARMKVNSPEFRANLGVFRGEKEKLIDGLGAQLRGLRSGFSAGPPGRPRSSPMGSSLPRQTSAVYLRPVKSGTATYEIVVFEAPADKVLGPDSKHGAPRLGNGLPLPEEAKQQAKRG